MAVHYHRVMVVDLPHRDGKEKEEVRKDPGIHNAAVVAAVAAVEAHGMSDGNAAAVDNMDYWNVDAVVVVAAAVVAAAGMDCWNVVVVEVLMEMEDTRMTLVDGHCFYCCCSPWSRHDQANQEEGPV